MQVSGKLKYYTGKVINFNFSKSFWLLFYFCPKKACCFECRAWPTLCEKLLQYQKL